MKKLMNKNKKSKAFTLAEVLITLGIIGVVASLLLPQLIRKYQDYQFKIAYKKAFSIANQAWTKALLDGKLVSRTSWTDSTARIANFKAFKSEFNVIKDCGGGSISSANCWETKGEGFNGGVFPAGSTSLVFIDASGVAWADEGSGSGIVIDTNGFRPPNRFGKDRFRMVTVVSGNKATNLDFPGIPIKLIPEADYVAPNNNYCIYGECYNTSWLLK